ncbi:MAG: 5-(carboxyamino)imidazole ribonucleotide mutase [Deltaproteobacteria bacterium]|nr:5-(carboxyamino)imidazole ribonucleotide mutase [Deltaproteobacteria bacterium]
MKEKPLVTIVMGSDSDFSVMEETGKTLDEFGVTYEYKVTSAHRSPDQAVTFAKGLFDRGIKVVIAGASYSAHLPGVLASHTTLPVIGVPLDASPLKGMEALFSMGQMPPGVPVATVTIGKAGAKNAALFAVEILATNDERLQKLLKDHRAQIAASVEEKDKNVRNS